MYNSDQFRKLARISRILSRKEKASAHFQVEGPTWPTIVEFVITKHTEQGYVTITDICYGLNISPVLALDIMKKFAVGSNWDLAIRERSSPEEPVWIP